MWRSEVILQNIPPLIILYMLLLRAYKAKVISLFTNSLHLPRESQDALGLKDPLEVSTPTLCLRYLMF